MGHFDRAAGEALRLARVEAGLTLRDVRARSDGRFKPSAVGAYERAERAVSLERFVALARIYGVPPDRLMARVIERSSPEERRSVSIDLTRLESVNHDVGRRLAELIARVRSERTSQGDRVIGLRSSDLQTLVLETDLGANDLMDKLRPALADDPALAEDPVLAEDGVR
jgi:transcriptional regulator with XRE-family HTH domain